MTREKTKKRTQYKDSIGVIYELVLYNDDINTFEHVIDVLIDVCELDEIQAEQIAFITHHKGKCAITSGPLNLLNPLNESISFKGLMCKIE